MKKITNSLAVAAALALSTTLASTPLEDLKNALTDNKMKVFNKAELAAALVRVSKRRGQGGTVFTVFSGVRAIFGCLSGTYVHFQSLYQQACPLPSFRCVAPFQRLFRDWNPTKNRQQRRGLSPWPTQAGHEQHEQLER